MTGLSAGSTPPVIAYWVNAGNTWYNSDQYKNKYTGRDTATMIGADITIDSQYILGISGGVDRQVTNLKDSNTLVTVQSVTVGPYLAYVIDDTYSIDAAGGFTRAADHLQVPKTRWGNYMGYKYYASGNVTATKNYDPFSLSLVTGVLYSASTTSTYYTTDGYFVATSKNRDTQIRTTGKIGYTAITSWGWMFPYGSARLEYDVNKSYPSIIDTSTGTTAANSLFGTTFGAGAIFGIGDSTSFTLDGSTGQFRIHNEVYSLTGTLRITF